MGFIVNQSKHTDRLELLSQDACFKDLRSIRAALAWVALTRPDISCAVNQASQVTEQNFVHLDIEKLNNAIRTVKTSADRGLIFSPVDVKSLYLKVYIDASFAGNKDCSSQIGFLILLCDTNNVCQVLDFSSRNSHRVVRSIMGGEVIAFGMGYDRAFILKHDLEQIYARKITLTMLTDSKQTFDVITKGSTTSERRLLIDICLAREAYAKGEIDHVGLVKSENNPADGLTKVKHCRALEDILVTGMDKNPVEQWIKRTTYPNSL